jgi:hypothetical protein
MKFLKCSEVALSFSCPRTNPLQAAKPMTDLDELEGKLATTQKNESFCIITDIKTEDITNIPPAFFV